ncbi:restriction endonuclease subunit S [Actinokineospora sp. 24-640]
MTQKKVSDLVAQRVLLVEDGNHGEYRPRPDEFVEIGVPFIRAADMSSGTIDFVGAGKINAVARMRIRKGIGKPGDVILSHKGTVGRVAVAPMNSPGFVCSPQTTFWRSLDPTALDQHYLRYAMQSPSFARQLEVLKGQTDMAPYVSLTDQRSINLELPSIREQRAVGEVLGALDDKIAANDRVLHLCVELCDAKFAHAVNGILPSDKTFDEIASVSGGGTPKTAVEDYWNGDILWATPTDVTSLPGPYLFSTGRMITQAGLDSCASTLYPRGSILMTSRATIGAFAIAQSPIAVNQGFIVVNAKDSRYQLWLFHEMRARVAEFVSHANGATFLELSRGRFKQFRVRTPDVGIALSFSQEVEPLHAHASQIIRESKKIANVRDELLPLLMSGKVRVQDAEKVVKGVV